MATIAQGVSSKKISWAALDKIKAANAAPEGKVPASAKPKTAKPKKK